MSEYKVYDNIRLNNYYKFKGGYVGPRGPEGYISNNAYSIELYRGDYKCDSSENICSLTGSYSLDVLFARSHTQQGLEIATNKAYSAFQDALKGPNSQLGATIGEYKSAYDMISKRALQLRTAYGAARRFDIKGLKKAFGVETASSGRLVRTRKGRFKWLKDPINKRPPKKLARFRPDHDASGLWLEYYFGWAPMLADLHLSARIIAGERLNTSQPPTIYGSGSSRHQFDTRQTPFTETGDSLTRVSYYGKARITNPNLWTLNRLGLLNPLAVAWELVPFSFVVDWIGNIGQVVGSFSDSIGVSVTNSGTTRKVTGSYSLSFLRPSPFVKWVESVTGERFSRSPGTIPRPTLVWNDRSLVTSHQRAATQISLLIQLFTKR